MRYRIYTPSTARTAAGVVGQKDEQAGGAEVVKVGKPSDDVIVENGVAVSVV